MPSDKKLNLLWNGAVESFGTPCGSVLSRFCVFDGVNGVPSMDSVEFHGFNGISWSQWISMESLDFRKIGIFTPKCLKT